jgi:predicted N-acetyltransferase YhbS
MMFRIEKLARTHLVGDFDCGQEHLNTHLAKYALTNQFANSAVTYVALADGAVVGFYSLTVGEILFDDASERLKKGLARHPVPVMLLARLAVAIEWQGKGLGSGLLRDAVRRTVQAADIAGVRALIVHAKDDAAKAFYTRFDFLPSDTDPLHLYVLIKDLKAIS